MKLTFGAGTDTGKVRKHNEDNYLIDRTNNIFIVCDGMGGHAAGEVASAMAVKVVREEIARHQRLLDAYIRGDESIGRRGVLLMLERAVNTACIEVFRKAQQTPQNRGMGTTIVALVIAGTRGFLAHVGDSRIYLLRQGQVHQLTEDHSLINELVKQGRVRSERGVPARYKSAVTRAVGVYESVQVDTLDFDVLSGDRFLLCTDGLHGYLTDNQLPALMSGESDQDAVARLLRYANSQGGRDNITAIVVSIPESGEDGREIRTQRKLQTLKSLELFRNLSYQEIVKVLNVAREESFPEGHRILREGDREGGLFVILEGEVAIEKNGTKMALAGPGALFGEMSLIDRGPRSADVIARSEVVTLSVSPHGFYELLRRNQELAVKLLWSFLHVMSARLRTTTDALSELKGERDAARLTGEQVGPVMMVPKYGFPSSETDEPYGNGAVDPEASIRDLVPRTTVISSSVVSELESGEQELLALGDTIPNLPVFKDSDLMKAGGGQPENDAPAAEPAPPPLPKKPDTEE